MGRSSMAKSFFGKGSLKTKLKLFSGVFWKREKEVMSAQILFWAYLGDKVIL